MLLSFLSLRLQVVKALAKTEESISQDANQIQCMIQAEVKLDMLYFLALLRGQAMQQLYIWQTERSAC